MDPYFPIDAQQLFRTVQALRANLAPNGLFEVSPWINATFTPTDSNSWNHLSNYLVTDFDGRYMPTDPREDKKRGFWFGSFHFVYGRAQPENGNSTLRLSLGRSVIADLSLQNQAFVTPGENLRLLQTIDPVLANAINVTLNPGQSTIRVNFSGYYIETPDLGLPE